MRASEVPEHEAGQAAKGSEERFSLLVESVVDYAIFILDPSGRIASWNAGAERIKGYRAGEVLGKHFSIFYPPEDLAGGKPARELEIAAREGRYVEEGWRLRKDGSRFWASVTLTALKDKTGRLTGFAKVTRDVSELRQAMDALRRSEERMRLMIEAVRDYAIFALDPTGHIASWNLGAQRLKGYTADEIIGKHLSVFYSEPDRVRGHPDDELRQALAEGRYEEEGWRVRKDGSRFWANVVITAVFDEEGQHIGFTKVTRDFTEARRLREAQVAVQVRDDFLSVASHELKTPLAALMMHVQSLVRNARPDDSAPKLKERLGRVAGVGKRLEKLIDQMLDFSRISAGRLRLDPEEVDLGELLREITDRYADEADIHTDVAAGISGFWDRTRVEQVVSNLVGNAVKYGKGQPIRVEGHRDGLNAVIRVIDHGIGIPADQQARIFERFERAVGDREFGGFGLGLWIARQIVDSSGGSIGVESEPGRGSTFTVTLPLQAAAGVDAQR